MEGFFGSFGGKVFLTFLISMAPVVELRGAIPYATANGINLWLAIAVSGIC